MTIEQTPETAPVADAGNSVWISIEGPGAGLLTSILFRDHGVRTLELREVEPWFFRARVVNYDQEGFELSGFSISDGTYVSEVDGEQVQLNPEKEVADEVEAGDTDDDSV